MSLLLASSPSLVLSSLGTVPPKERMEGRVVCKRGLHLSGLTVSLQRSHVGSWLGEDLWLLCLPSCCIPAGPPNKHQQPQGELPSPHPQQLRKGFGNLEVGWGGKQRQTKGSPGESRMGFGGPTNP